MLAPTLSLQDSPAPALSLPALRQGAADRLAPVVVAPSVPVLPSRGFRLRSYTHAPYFARPPRLLRGGYLP